MKSATSNNSNNSDNSDNEPKQSTENLRKLLKEKINSSKNIRHGKLPQNNPNYEKDLQNLSALPDKRLRPEFIKLIG